MSRVLRFAAAFASLAMGAPKAVDLTGATLVQARLLTPVSSYHSKRGAEIEAVVVACMNQKQHLPAGTVLRGEISKVKKVGIGLVHECATLELNFNGLVLPDGRDYAVESRLIGIDNARERVDRHGAIHGPRVTDSLSHRFGARIAFAAMGHPLFLLPAYAIETGVFRFPDPEIDYRAGTELALKVQLPQSLAVAVRPAGADDPAPAELESLRAAVEDVPYWSYSKRQRQSMDLVNLAFVGTREELERAFAAAGWTGARPNSMGSGLKAIRAVVEDRVYADAPMRTLLLDGREPDLVRQKTLNTFEKRDHLRIWRLTGTWQGRPVWAGAATRDIATTFSMRPFGFTHQIEKDVDLERDQVVDDLAFAGCVDTLANVGRPARVVDSEDYRKGVNTDSRMAVLVLNSCSGPGRNVIEGAGSARPSVWVRGLRRVVLTARNHFMRDNIVWRSGDAARVGIRAARDLYVARKRDRRVEEEQESGWWPESDIVAVR